jgi:hypothetical protein
MPIQKANEDIRGRTVMRIFEAEIHHRGIKLSFLEVKALMQIIKDHGHILPLKRNGRKFLAAARPDRGGKESER